MSITIKALAPLTSAALLALALPTAQAIPVEVDFSDGTNSGTFFYDDSAATNGTQNPFQQGGVSYDGLGFIANGVAQSAPFYVEIYDNFNVGGTLYDIVYFTAGSSTSNASPLLQLACIGCLADSSLSQLTGMSLAGFTATAGADVNNFYAGQYDGFTNGNNLASLRIAAVPEPATAALLGLGLLGLGFASKRRML